MIYEEDASGKFDTRVGYLERASLGLLSLVLIPKLYRGNSDPSRNNIDHSKMNSRIRSKMN